jgi:hypothetical protein
MLCPANIVLNCGLHNHKYALFRAINYFGFRALVKSEQLIDIITY